MDYTNENNNKLELNEKKKTLMEIICFYGLV